MSGAPSALVMNARPEFGVASITSASLSEIGIRTSWLVLSVLISILRP